jgi:hypothetical protein
MAAISRLNTDFWLSRVVGAGIADQQEDAPCANGELAQALGG